MLSRGIVFLCCCALDTWKSFWDWEGKWASWRWKLQPIQQSDAARGIHHHTLPQMRSTTPSVIQWHSSMGGPINIIPTEGNYHLTLPSHGAITAPWEMVWLAKTSRFITIVIYYHDNNDFLHAGITYTHTYNNRCTFTDKTAKVSVVKDCDLFRHTRWGPWCISTLVEAACQVCI